MQKRILLLLIFCTSIFCANAQDLPKNRAGKSTSTIGSGCDSNQTNSAKENQTNSVKETKTVSVKETQTVSVKETKTELSPIPFETTNRRESTLGSSTRKPLLSIKTNLLFDVASLLNFEVEVPIGKRFSVAGELVFPWWLFQEKQHCLQMMSGTLEGRIWLGNRDNQRSGAVRTLMTGFFAGLYAGGGYYDLEWEKKGYQGEFFIAAGVSAGYAHAIGRNLKMEYSLGVGYLRTQYKQYQAKMDKNEIWHLYRQKEGRYTWIGPTRAKVSLVWTINHNVKRGGAIR